MQCGHLENTTTPLNELDSALNELGMLSARANEREEYVAELCNRRCLNMLTINTRYVSNVSVGFRVRPVAPHIRYKPYLTTKERHRTKSENNDNEATPVEMDVIPNVDATIDEITHLKKAKSLESIIAENGENVNFKNISLAKPSELEVVSNSIQNLRVVE